MGAPIVWTNAMIAQLGTRSDREVAGDLGLAPSTVCYRRRALGIAPWIDPGGAIYSQYDWSGVDWSQPNSKIAELLGCRESTVHYQRLARR